ncbi:hypothetical protein QUB70_24845 [Microcoleus sp. A003_D6]
MAEGRRKKEEGRRKKKLGIRRCDRAILRNGFRNSSSSHDLEGCCITKNHERQTNFNRR